MALASQVPGGAGGCPLGTTLTRQAADKGPAASLAAAGSTYGKYASPAAFGRRLASGPFSPPWPVDRAGRRVGAGAASADPYLLRRFSKPTTRISWRRRERKI